jgi:putative Holliday junction resolvase
MAKVIALDVGTKRTGVAETDPMQIIATGLTTVKTPELLKFLKDYVAKENPQCLVIGQPKRLHGELGNIEGFIVELISKISKKHPNLPIERIDERFTSKMAFQTMIDSGLKKKDRANKELIDEVSATIILQSWLSKK